MKFINQDVGLKPSSQTTMVSLNWDPIGQTTSKVTIGDVSHFYDARTAKPDALKGKTWNEIAEEVLRERSEAWERLAIL
jgi:hypothetical protein